MVGCAIDEMSANGPAFATSPGPKAMAGPYVLLANLRPGRAGSCLTWAGGCGAHTPYSYEPLYLSIFSYRTQAAAAPYFFSTAALRERDVS